MQTLYNHSHLNSADYESHNAEKYRDLIENGTLHGGRALPCTTPEDAIQLDPRLKSSLPYMAEHFESVGLAVTDNIIWDAAPEIAGEFPDHELSVYLFGREFHDVRPDEARLEATRSVNNKNDFIAHCQEAGYPVPDTLIVREGTKPDPSIELPLPVYVKAARSSTGVSIFRAADRAGFEKSIRQVGSEYQIQAEVPNTLAFLNVQYRAVGSTAVHFATTEQILNGFAYAGTQFPSQYDSRELTDPLADELAQQGLGEIFAFDVAVTPDEMAIIECNGRWNGASYPTTIARRLGIEEWTTHSQATELEHPKDIHIDDLAYDQGHGYGVIVVNSGFMATSNEVSVMLAGPLEAREELGAKIRERIGIKDSDDVLQESATTDELDTQEWELQYHRRESVR